MKNTLPGKRILIVEDNPILAYDISDLMDEVGAEPVGPALDVGTGMQLVRENDLDAALLDVDIGGEYVWPIAEELERHSVPYVFVSAQCRTDLLPEPFKGRRCIEKPAAHEEIVEALIAFTGEPNA